MTEPVNDRDALSVSGLHKSFGSNHAVHGVSLTLLAGRVHALLGENGAGKSTLIAMLTGFEHPDSGTIAVGDSPQQYGFDSPRAALDSGIVTVFQQSSLIPELTIAQNIELQPRASLNRARELLTAVSPMSLNMDSRVKELDLGSRTVVEVARACSANPRILILDEPTALVDSATADRLLALVREQAEAGVAVLIVTHKLSEVLRVADDVTVLRNGAESGDFSGVELRALPERDAQRLLLSAMFGASARQVDAVEVQRKQDHEIPAPIAPPLKDNERLNVLDVSGLPGLSFSAQPGEILGIAGIAGNGQRELAELLEGTRHRDGLKILLDGVDVTRLSVRARQRRGIASLTDDRNAEGLVPSLSVGLNLVLKRIGDHPFWRGGFTQRRAIREHALHAISVSDVRVASPDVPASTLSGGNAQKLLIARDVQPTARVTIFRQPTQGLDAKTSEAVHDILRDVSRRGGAVILISNDLDEVVSLAHRILVLERGVFTAEVVGRREDTREQVAEAISGVRS